MEKIIRDANGRICEIHYLGYVGSIREWAETIGPSLGFPKLSRKTLSDRLRKGWSFEDAIKTPPMAAGTKYGGKHPWRAKTALRRS